MKDSTLCCVRRLFFLGCILLATTSCDNNQSSENKTSAFALDDLTSSSIKPNSIESISPLLTLQTPINIWSNTTSTNLQNHVKGPHLAMSNGGNGFVSLLKTSGTDPLTGNYAAKKSVVFNYTIGNGWNEEPISSNPIELLSDEIDIKTTESGNAFALWSNNDELLFSYNQNNTGWASELSITTGDTQHYLLVDREGNCWIFWVLGSDIFLQKFVMGTGANSGLQNVETSTIDNAWTFKSPITDANGVIYIPWISLSNFSNPSNVTSNYLNLIRFDSISGWSPVETAPPLISEEAMGSHLSLVHNINDEVMAISQDMRGRIFAISFSPTNNWGKWENIDFNLNKNDRVTRSANVSSAGDNNIIVIWTEATNDASGAPVYNVYANKFNPIADVDGLHWPIPDKIASMAQQQDEFGNRINGFKRYPKIKISPNGQAFAIWHNASGDNSILYSSQYTPTTGWSNPPDLITSYNKQSTGKVKSPDIALLSNGTVFISWLQVIFGEFTNERNLWTLQGQL